MKSSWVLIPVTLLIILINSCSSKRDESEVNFSVIGFANSSSSAGVMIYGKSDSLNLAFAKSLNNLGTSTTLAVPKGPWTFMALTWDGANPLEGNAKCAQVQKDLSQKDETVSLNLNLSNCDSNSFANSNFRSASSFLPLRLISCDDASIISTSGSNCDGSKGDSLSYKIILVDYDFSSLSTGASSIHTGLESICINEDSSPSSVTNTSFRIPVGGSGISPIYAQILSFPTSNCSGSANNVFDYSRGIFNSTSSQQVVFSDGNYTELYLGTNQSGPVTGPTITNVTSTTTNGTYGISSTISIDITFSEAVDVQTGVPSLALNSSSSASYTTGSGTNTLNFSYTVASGQSSADLDYSSVSALNLNGASIVSSSNATAGNLTLPTPGAAGSLGNNKDIVIDATAPSVTSISSPKTDGHYTTSEAISIEVTFNKTVYVTGGTPTLQLETGATDQNLNYSSGSGTTKLVFDYTVAGGDTSADLDIISTSALALNGATIQDAVGNNADLTLMSPGALGSLAANKAIVIDTTAPSSATALGWSETSPHNNLNLTAQWSVSASGDLADQELRFFTDSGCSTAASGFLTLGSSTQNSYSFAAGSNNTSYYFYVKSIDQAGNVATSTCSSALYVSFDNTITVSTATPSNQTNTSFDITVPFTGDDNNDSTATISYCSDTVEVTCDPTGMNTTPLNRNSVDFTQTITGLIAGHTYNLLIEVNDPDGASGTPENLQVTLPCFVDNDVYGCGNDGSHTVSTVLSSSDTSLLGRTLSYSTKVTAITDTGGGNYDLTVPPMANSTDFQLGDQLMWIVMGEGSTDNCPPPLNAGDYGFLKLTSSPSASTTTLSVYGSMPATGSGGLVGPITGTGFCRIQIVRVVQFANLTVSTGGKLQPSSADLDNATGGVLPVRVMGKLDISTNDGSTPAFDASGKGFYDGTATGTSNPAGIGIQGKNSTPNTNSYGSGGGSGVNGDGAGGGSNGGNGGNASQSGMGANKIGTLLSCSASTCDPQMTLALGGQGGHGYNTSAAVSGSAGGGIIYLYASETSDTGSLKISANGNGAPSVSADGYGGGGGGGVVFERHCNINSPIMTTGAAIVQGGLAGDGNAGAAGVSGNTGVYNVDQVDCPSSL